MCFSLHALADTMVDSLLQAITLAQQNQDDRELAEAYKLLSQYYAEQEDYKSAASYFQKYLTLHELIFSSEITDNISELEVRYAASQKEKELELLKKEKKLHELEIAKSRNERNSIILIFLLIFTLVIIFLSRYRMHAKLHKKLDGLNKKLLDLTETDPVTELYNRRFLLEKIEYLKCQFERSKISFSVLMGDIDNFKEVNDTYGHNLGDKALIQLAETIKETVRKQDFVGRWGGDEFMLLLPETDDEGAQTIAYKIENTISQTVFGDNRHNFYMGITFGFAEYNEEQAADEIIKKADVSLYVRKEERKAEHQSMK
jgi:diguanylate cyclase (GGDEF)-like protein